MMLEGLLISDPTEIVLEIGRIGRWVQAVGLIVIAWVIIQIINYITNQKRLKTLGSFREDIKRIEGKIDKLSNLRKG